MKTGLQCLGLAILTYFTFVPPKVEVKEFKYSSQSITIDNDIKSKIDTIERNKNRIYQIQQELGIK